MLAPVTTVLHKTSAVQQMVSAVRKSTSLPHTAAGEASMQRLSRAVLVSGRWRYAVRSCRTERASTSS